MWLIHCKDLVVIFVFLSTGIKLLSYHFNSTFHALDTFIVIWEMLDYDCTYTIWLVVIESSCHRQHLPLSLTPFDNMSLQSFSSSSNLSDRLYMLWLVRWGLLLLLTNAPSSLLKLVFVSSWAMLFHQRMKRAALWGVCSHSKIAWSPLLSPGFSLNDQLFCVLAVMDVEFVVEQKTCWHFRFGTKTRWHDIEYPRRYHGWLLAWFLFSYI